MLGPLIYTLCALTSAVCFVLLWRAYASSRSGILFWSAACFALQTLNNLVLVADKVFLPDDIDLKTPRLAMAFVAACMLLYGLIQEDK